MHLRSTGDSSAAGPTSSVWRVLGFAAAVALGAVGVWLIVTATSQKWTELGVLAGLWGLLIGAFAAFGPRHTAPADVVEEPARQPEVPAARTAEVERLDDAAQRRDYEARLELMLRREIQAAMSREVAVLRAEVAQLRTDLVEKVGGQLRLERIETTRVIGSDIEALQREIDQLKGDRPTGTTRTLRSLPTVIEVEEAQDDAGGRRRRHDDGDGNDLLAQILARETVGRRGS